jgi:dienelactone hydrolase
MVILKTLAISETITVKRSALAAMAVLASLAVDAQAQEHSDIPVRQEFYAYASQTLSDTQFLTGQSGRPVTLTAGLSLPAGDGPFPAVILQHGSGGIGDNIAYWQRTLNQQGIATFVLDGFTGRGLVSTGKDQAQLGRLNFILDEYRALALLAEHPRVDASRIVLMGFSRGGQASLYASLERFQKQWKGGETSFAAYIAFYPDCSISFKDEDKVAGKPIRVFHGEADDYDPLSRCTPYLDRLAKAGADVKIFPYPDAHHGFDSPSPQSVRVAQGSQTVRACQIAEGEQGVLVNQATGEPFRYTDACVALDPHVGPNAAATQQATEDVLTFLKTVLDKP